MVPGGLVSTEWTEDSCSFFVFDQELRHLLGKRAYTTDGDVEYAPADWHGGQKETIFLEVLLLDS